MGDSSIETCSLNKEVFSNLHYNELLSPAG